MSQIRLRLDSGPTLRVDDAGHDDQCARLVAELPWLRTGAAAELQLERGSRRGRIDWIGLEPAPDGTARLTLRVAFDRTRPESTLPYFSTREMQALRTEEPPLINDEPTLAFPREPLSIVQEAHARRAAVAVWRVGLASLAVLALLGLAFGIR